MSLFRLIHTASAALIIVFCTLSILTLILLGLSPASRRFNTSLWMIPLLPAKILTSGIILFWLEPGMWYHALLVLSIALILRYASKYVLSTNSCLHVMRWSTVSGSALQKVHLLSVICLYLFCQKERIVSCRLYSV